MFKLNLADCQKCLDNMKINGFSCPPIWADFTGKNRLSVSGVTCFNNIVDKTIIFVFVDAIWASIETLLFA